MSKKDGSIGDGYSVSCGQSSIPLGEPGRYAVPSGFQLVVVVRPLANFPILHLHNRDASRTNWCLSQTPVQKKFGLGSRKRPFTNDAVAAAEDAVDSSFGIRVAFTYLSQEFGQASLVLKFESECMVGECEFVVKLIYDFHNIPLSPGC